VNACRGSRALVKQWRIDGGAPMVDTDGMYRRVDAPAGICVGKK